MHQKEISIHALREEGDLLPTSSSGQIAADFYPRPPRGGRLVILMIAAWSMLFLSTPSARRATSRSALGATALPDFYPRPPRGGRPHDIVFVGERNFISIHALREEGDR